MTKTRHEKTRDPKAARTENSWAMLFLIPAFIGICIIAWWITHPAVQTEPKCQTVAAC